MHWPTYYLHYSLAYSIVIKCSLFYSSYIIQSSWCSLYTQFLVYVSLFSFIQYGIHIVIVWWIHCPPVRIWIFFDESCFNSGFPLLHNRDIFRFLVLSLFYINNFCSRHQFQWPLWQPTTQFELRSPIRSAPKSVVPDHLSRTHVPFVSLAH